MPSPFPYVRKLIRSWYQKRKQLPIRRGPAGIKPHLETLENRIVPVNPGVAQISLNFGSVASPLSTAQSNPTNTVPVYIDFDNQTGPGTIMGADSVVFPTAGTDLVNSTARPGTVRFSYNGSQATNTINVSTATATALLTNLKTISALSSLTSSNVTGNTGGPFTVTFPSGVTGGSLLTVANGTGSSTVLSTYTFSYNGSAGSAFSYTSSTTAAQFLSYLETVPGLTGSGNVTGVTGSGTSGSPFVANFGSGIKGGNILTCNNTGRP